MNMIRSKSVQKFIIHLVSFSLLSIGFAQSSGAGMIGTQAFIDGNARSATVTRVEALLARQDVADSLQTFGVEPAFVMSRVDNMTQAELVQLEGRLDQNIAGGDAIAVIGVVFLVLMILELVGVTDIFKSI
jgi:hypothetical protein